MNKVLASGYGAMRVIVQERQLDVVIEIPSCKTTINLKTLEHRYGAPETQNATLSVTFGLQQVHP